MKKLVTLHYYGEFEDIAKKREEIIPTISITLNELYTELTKKYAFTLQIETIRFLLNEYEVSNKSKFGTHDHISLIPTSF
ncbi:hypothetical protein HOG98_04655 [bacterium]|jgi:molybdopterin converting factor small subunit|nr:hypothetical protein [bacterium]